MIDEVTGPVYLKDTQYQDSSNLSKRAFLHKDFGTDLTSWQSWLMDKVDLPGQETILEIGSGPGYF